jgi:hypothetical protein
MYPATEMALHLGDVCVDQRPALATLRAAIRALHVRHQPAPHHVARAKALAAGQIAGSAGAVSNAREASRPQLRPPSSRTTAAGRQPDPDLPTRPQQVKAPRFISGMRVRWALLQWARRMGAHVDWAVVSGVGRAAASQAIPNQAVPRVAPISRDKTPGWV